jgi:hypothetical protein
MPTTGVEMVRAGLIALGADDSEAALLADELEQVYRLNKKVMLASTLEGRCTVLGTRFTDIEMIQIINYISHDHMQSLCKNG